MIEKNILTYFHRREDAEQVERELLALGAISTKINETSSRPGNGVDHIVQPINSDFASLTSLTLGAEGVGRNEGILLAADVSSSGMSAEGNGFEIAPNFLLTAVVDEKIHKEALKIVDNYGGIV